MDNWQPGDLALCVHAVHNPSAIGRVFTVVEVDGAGIAEDGEAVVGLLFANDPPPGPNAMWDARDYRKIHPLTDEERESFLADLRMPVTA